MPARSLVFGAFFAVAVLWSWFLAQNFWQPKGYEALRIPLAVLGAGVVYLFTLSGRHDRSWNRSVQYCALAAAGLTACVLVQFALVESASIELDKDIAQSGEELPDKFFPSGRVVHLAAMCSEVEGNVEREPRTDTLKAWIKDGNGMEYWMHIEEHDGPQLLKLRLAFLATLMGASLSAAAFLGLLGGMVTGAGVRGYEDPEVPLPAPDEPIDVFLSYGHNDTELVQEIAKRLRQAGLSVWFDRWDAPPGTQWPARIHTAIQTAHSAAIFRGATDTGHWQELEINGFHTRTHRGLPLIPVMLPGCQGPGDLTGLLAAFTAVDLRDGVNGPGMQLLLEAIPVASAAPESVDS